MMEKMKKIFRVMVLIILDIILFPVSLAIIITYWYSDTHGNKKMVEKIENFSDQNWNYAKSFINGEDL